MFWKSSQENEPNSLTYTFVEMPKKKYAYLHYYFGDQLCRWARDSHLSFTWSWISFMAISLATYREKGYAIRIHVIISVEYSKKFCSIRNATTK